MISGQVRFKTKKSNYLSIVAIPMYVASVTVTVQSNVLNRKKTKVWAEAVVTVHDGDGNPVAGATACGTWSDATRSSLDGHPADRCNGCGCFFGEPLFKIGADHHRIVGIDAEKCKKSDPDRNTQVYLMHREQFAQRYHEKVHIQKPVPTIERCSYANSGAIR